MIIRTHAKIKTTKNNKNRTHTQPTHTPSTKMMSSDDGASTRLWSIDQIAEYYGEFFN